MNKFYSKLQHHLLAAGMFTEESEMKAIVTHLIQSPQVKPALLDNSSYEQLKNMIGEFPEDETTSGEEQLDFSFESEVVPFPPVKNSKFTFIDLFAGIGGIRLAMQKSGGECVFSSEWDKNAKQTYYRNFGEMPYGDITKVDANEIPDHDVLCGGFPCQAFSVAGYRQGFEDKQGRGNLFFNIVDILKTKKPKAFLLENVKNLVGHDKGNTFKRIKEELAVLGYSLDWKVLNSKEYGNTPQTRERIFIVGFRNENTAKKFTWPVAKPLTKMIHDVLENEVPDEFYYNQYKIYDQIKESVTKRDTIYQWRRVYVRENKSNACPTLTANMGTGGHNVPLVLDNKDVRKLTPRECARFQGFPDEYKFPKLAKSHLYKQIGNSVTMPLVARVAKEIRKVIVE